MQLDVNKIETFYFTLFFLSPVCLLKRVAMLIIRCNQILIDFDKQTKKEHAKPFFKPDTAKIARFFYCQLQESNKLSC